MPESRQEKMPSVPRSMFIEPYGEALGVEKANLLFDEAIKELGLPSLDFYSKEQGKAILEHLKTQGGLIKLMAVTIATRLILRGLYPEK